MKALGQYLNDHLSGSFAADHLLDALIDGNPPNRAIYESLRHAILQNRKTLETLLHLAGFTHTKRWQTAARLVSHFAVRRFKNHGLKTGQLGLVEALEALELGVHGQTLLWRGLMDHAEAVGPWQGADFAALWKSAELQKHTVETLRMESVRAAFFHEPK